MSTAAVESEPTKVTQVLSRDEIRDLNTKSDLAGVRTVLVNWSMIGVCFVVVGIWPNPLTILAALVILGGRQLGLAVITHDAAHQSLFRTRSINRLAGNWLGAAMVFSDMDSYYAKHQVHHRQAGSEGDPDLANYQQYAVSKASFRRKILRDLTGRTGFKALRSFFKQSPVIWWRSVVANLALLGVLWMFGKPWLYLLWLVSYLTTFMLVSRLRQAAEHAVVPDLTNEDPRMNTRTTMASWWERLTFAPNHVNYHLEHHLLPGIPPQQLPVMHQMLKERGFYRDADISPGYADVVSRLTKPSQPN